MIRATICNLLFVAIMVAHLQVSEGCYNTPRLSPRRARFFSLVESGLSERFSRHAVEKVTEGWVKYAKGEKPLPAKTQEFHEPSEEYIPNLTARPWWDNRDSFEWIAPLEEASSIILAELNKELEDASFVSDSNYQSLMGEGWSSIRLLRNGVWNGLNCAKFPLTTRIVKALRIPLATRGIMFARQRPGSGVQAHSDGRNFILTCHLGLKVPTSTECWISVADEKRQWEQGKALIFDTSFTHCTGNDTDEDRFVLIIDFWHPELTQAEIDALQFIYDTRNKFESGEIQ